MRLLEAKMKMDQKDEEAIQKAKEEGKEIKIKDNTWTDKDWENADLENSLYIDKEFPRVKDVQTVLLLDDLKGYVVLEAQDPPSMFNAIQGIRHIRGQLRGELQYSEIDKYLIKKSTVTELSVDNTVEIIGGPFKGMKATVQRVDKEKEEAVVILLDAPYQLPVTVDANHLKKVLS